MDTCCAAHAATASATVYCSCYCLANTLGTPQKAKIHSKLKPKLERTNVADLLHFLVCSKLPLSATAHSPGHAVKPRAVQRPERSTEFRVFSAIVGPAMTVLTM